MIVQKDNIWVDEEGHATSSKLKLFLRWIVRTEGCQEARETL